MRVESGDVPEQRTKKISQQLATASLLLWIASLFLPAIIKAGHSTMLGWEVLLLGWLSIGLNFAWLANPFLLYAATNLLDGKPSPWLALTASALGINAFILPPGAAGDNGFYGFGWGAVAWLGAIFLMLAAAGFSQIENRHNTWWQDRGFEWLKPLGIVLLIVLCSAAGFCSVNIDQQTNSPSRKSVHYAVVFKTIYQ